MAEFVNGPTFVGDDGFVYEVQSLIDHGPTLGIAAGLRRLWPAEQRAPLQWWCKCCHQNRGDGRQVPCEHFGFMDPPKVPRWEKIDYPPADGYGPYEMTRAICEPEGYCKDGHRCGQLDVGIRRDSQLNTRNDFAIFAEQFSALAGEEPVQ